VSTTPQGESKSDIEEAREVISQALGDLQIEAPLSHRVRHALGDFMLLLAVVERIRQAYPKWNPLDVDVLRIRSLLPEAGHLAPNEAINLWESTEKLILKIVDAIQTDGSLVTLLTEDLDLRRDLVTLHASSQAYAGASQAVRAVYQMKTDAEAILASMKLAAGSVGEHRLTEHYSTYARHETLKSLGLRITAALLGVLIITIALSSGAASAKSASEWGLVGVRGTVALTLGAFAVYASRLASSHRTNGDWAKALEVQLRTSEAFLAPLPDDYGLPVYQEFARRVLGPPPGSAEPASLVMPPELLLRNKTAPRVTRDPSA